MKKRTWAIGAIIIVNLFLGGGVCALAGEEGAMAGMTRAHNSVRAELGLPGIAWSDDLAQSARQWAQFLADRNSCDMHHRPDRGEEGLPYGENLYWASAVRLPGGARKGQDISAPEVVSAWAGERRDYDQQRHRCRRGRSCGHYTQIVWKATRRLGCGMATCADLSQIWVCNYDPPGNYLGQAPF